MSAYPYAIPAGLTAGRKGLRVAVGLAVVGLLVVIAPLLILSGQQPDQLSGAGLPAGAQPFVAIYQDAGRAFAVSPFLLMAVHETETAFSTSTAAGVADAINVAGCCAGPMQFSITAAASNTAGGAGGTWATYRNAYTKARIARPDSYPGRFTAHTPNVYDSFDAIYAAAAYFHALGAGPALDDRAFRALESYGGTPPASIPYARHTLHRARALEQLASADASSGELGDVTGSPLQKVIGYANRIESLHVPYCWGGGHATKPGPSPGISYCHTSDHSQVIDTHTPGLDCSGSVRWLLVLAGFRDPGGVRSDLLGAAFLPGTGRHVTIWSAPDHVFLTIEGRGWGTSQANYRNGPGWAPHTTDGFRPSHPPGL